MCTFMCIRSIHIHSVNRNSSGFVCLQNQELQQNFRISLVLFVTPEKLPKETIPTSSVFSFPILSSCCYDSHKKRKSGCLSRKILQLCYSSTLFPSSTSRLKQIVYPVMKDFSVLTPTLMQSLNHCQFTSTVITSLPFGSFGTEG